MVHGQAAPRGVARNLPRRVGLHGHKFGAQFPADTPHIVFVFLAVEGAGAVHEVSALAQGWPNVLHNLPLPRGAVRHGLRAPFLHGPGILAEHALARTGHIGGHHVEEAAQGGEVFGIAVCHHGVGVSPLRQVFGQHLGALPHGFVGHEQGTVGEQAAPERALSAGGGTEVEHALRRCLFRELAASPFHKHRGRFLHVVAAGVEQRVEGEGGSLRQVAAFGAPGHGALHGGGQRGGALQRVEAHTHGGRGLFEGFAEGLGFGRTEQAVQLVSEREGEHGWEGGEGRNVKRLLSLQCGARGRSLRGGSLRSGS